MIIAKDGRVWFVNETTQALGLIISQALTEGFAPRNVDSAKLARGRELYRWRGGMLAENPPDDGPYALFED